MGEENAFWFGRFRSARKKIRTVKTDFEKQLLKLGRERKTLLKIKNNLGYEPLIPPVQKGFKRFFVLRDDVAQGTRAAFFQGILDKINNVQYSDTRQFTRTRRYRGRKIKVQKEQFVKSVSAYDWGKQRLSPEQATYFEEALEQTAFVEWRRVFRFIDPWRFRLKIAPNMITEKRRQDAALEKRIAEIENYLECNFLEENLQKLLHGYTRYFSYNDSEKPGYANPLKNKPLYRILESDQDKPAPVLS